MLKINNATRILGMAKKNQREWRKKFESSGKTTICFSKNCISLTNSIVLDFFVILLCHIVDEIFSNLAFVYFISDLAALENIAISKTVKKISTSKNCFNEAEELDKKISTKGLSGVLHFVIQNFCFLFDLLHIIFLHSLETPETSQNPKKSTELAHKESNFNIKDWHS